MARPRRESPDQVDPYGELAGIYDIVHRKKPYAQEARTVRALVGRYAQRPCRTLLDVACGSGRHLEQFVRWFNCTGVDASPSMLSEARRRVPRAHLALGRMTSFDLGRQFDVVTCLFSAIGYVRSAGELRRTLRNFARHTAPGGLVVVEPWLTPGVFRSGHVHHVLAQSEGTTVVRMDAGRKLRGRSLFDFHYVVGRKGRVEHFVETHDLGLFDARTMKAAFRAAGLDVRHIRHGFATGRGLYVARRPGSAKGPIRTRASGRRSRQREGP